MSNFTLPTAYKPLVNQVRSHVVACEKGTDGNDDGTSSSDGSGVLSSPQECVAAVEQYQRLLDEDTSFENTSVYGLLDIRALEQFQQAHIKNSTSMPWGCNGEDLWNRIHELPPRGQPIAVISDSWEDLNSASQFLGTTRVMKIVFQILLHEDVIRALAKEAFWVRPDKRNITPYSKLGRRLWTASQCLRILISKVEEVTCPPRTALDVGCAQGRECVWLATRQGWDVVVGSDVVRTKLMRYNDLSSRYDTKARCVAILADIRKAEDDKKVLASQGPVLGADQQSGFSLVHVSRFLHRASFERIRDVLVKPGGCLVFHTFVEGVEIFGRPRRKKHILKLGELAKFFGQDAGWKILMDEVRPLEDGRPVSYFLAQKPELE